MRQTVRLQWPLVPNVCVDVTAFCFVLLLFSCKEAALGLEHTELTGDDMEWRPATATWYGRPDGDGSDGGACGYGGLVDQKPLRARVGAVSPVLFKGGEGCGACYKVKCMQKDLCSDKPVTVVITDECPGGYCASGRTHFDLSGAAFGRMATNGKTPALLNSGELPVLYRRTLCEYPGKNITFHVTEGSTVYWFSILVEYEDGDGDVGAVHLKQAESDAWMEMSHVWGANWCLLGGSSPLKAPFSLRVTTLTSKRTLSARNVIPEHWYTNATYKARLNFDDKPRLN